MLLPGVLQQLLHQTVHLHDHTRHGCVHSVTVQTDVATVVVIISFHCRYKSQGLWEPCMSTTAIFWWHPDVQYQVGQRDSWADLEAGVLPGKPVILLSQARLLCQQGMHLPCHLQQVKIYCINRVSRLCFLYELPLSWGMQTSLACLGFRCVHTGQAVDQDWSIAVYNEQI